MTKHQLPHVVIVGGGFGGLAVARALPGSARWQRIHNLGGRPQRLLWPSTALTGAGSLLKSDKFSPRKELTW
jgi:cation diffusion facilitator CzcD-associated flavoprotein CzcO